MVEEALWNNYFESRDKSCFQALYEFYLKWIDEEARRVYFALGLSKIDMEDVIQISRLASLEAIKKFDVDKGVSFKNYARIRIKGEVINKLPGYSEEQALMRAVLNISKSRKKPSKEPIDLFEKVLNIVISHTKDILYYDYFHQLEQRQESVERQRELEDLHRMLERGLAKLTDKEKAVIEYSFIYGMAINQIADVLEISKSRVSQLSKQGLEKLDKYFEVYAPELVRL